MTAYELLLIDRIEKIQSIDKKYNLRDNSYLSFSGGKDSTVLHHLLDLALPNNNIPRVFINTGIEYKLTVDFVKELQKNDSRFVIIAPSVNIKKTLETYGYPFKSKQHSEKVRLWQQGSRSKSVLLYQFDDSFKLKLSPQCCNKMKKEPAKLWAKQNNKTITLTGMMQAEGGQRSTTNCIVTKNDKLLKFHPLFVLNEQWEEEFIKQNNVVLNKLYLPPYNFKRTGCKGCPFALDLQQVLDVPAQVLPNERKQCEAIWKPVYDEYRRINYRLKNQTTIYDFIKEEN